MYHFSVVSWRIWHSGCLWPVLDELRSLSAGTAQHSLTDSSNFSHYLLIFLDPVLTAPAQLVQEKPALMHLGLQE